MHDRSQDLPVAMSMCYTFETTGVARAVPERIATHGYRGLRMRHQLYVMSHAEVLVPCILDGLQFIFNPR